MVCLGIFDFPGSVPGRCFELTAYMTSFSSDLQQPTPGVCEHQIFKPQKPHVLISIDILINVLNY